MKNELIDSIINFYINTTDNVAPGGSLSLTGLNSFNDSNSTLEIKWNQASINSKTNSISLKFIEPFDSKCKFILVSGKIFVTLGDSSILMFPVGIIDPRNLNKEGFTIIAPPYQVADYRFDLTYIAIGE